MVDRTRFTTEQVLRGIQAYVDEQFGEPFPLDSDASVSVYYETVQKEMGCPLEFLTELGWYFGLTWNESRWSVWLRLPRTSQVRLTAAERQQQWQAWLTEASQPLTIRKLASYIARHARGYSMEPVTVFGVHCAPAGAFRGLCSMPEVNRRQIAPSTPIASMLPGSRIEKLWSRAAWISGTQLPALKQTPWWSLCSLPNWIDAIGLGSAIIATITTLIVVGVVSGSVWGAFLSALIILIGLITVTGYTSDYYSNPLPDGVETFGDLARLIAEHNPSAAS